MNKFTKEYYETNNYSDYLSREPRYHKLAEEIFCLLSQLKLISHSTKILDYGCSFGFLIKGLKKLGVTNIKGFDISEYASSVAKEAGVDLVEFTDETFDIIFALDVLEHMTDEQINQFNSTFSTKVLVGRIPVSTDGVNFHLYVSNQDVTHINCKTKEQWKNVLSKFGYSTILELNLISIYDSPGVFSFIALR